MKPLLLININVFSTHIYIKKYSTEIDYYFNYFTQMIPNVDHNFFGQQLYERKSTSTNINLISILQPKYA